MLRFLTEDEIIKLQIATIEHHGGDLFSLGCLLGDLKYIVESVNLEVFGEPRYPSIYDKAAFYCTKIIQEHIFYDGNKRVGILSAFFFLKINNYTECVDISNQDIESLGISVATNHMDLLSVSLWFKQRFYCIDAIIY
ncbi:type II toxin-antitoxin system death-on-curing family toxin [uncultured Sphaerochaeta sp.]|uniref:type II toxin-antitoxin system death-on-curing family toxin n=1 Tax=uncultured Sphaerochaeta sp. TaxID=886478 RepID=UPI002A0A3E05|nr:type II toxin-antitoxin system death-on-curing family toxin [uncultured Sphaerochaeta sp.]